MVDDDAKTGCALIELGELGNSGCSSCLILFLVFFCRDNNVGFVMTE